jgi:hypothetical protein
MNELRARGVADILIAVVDGLKGCPEAINAAFLVGGRLIFSRPRPPGRLFVAT